jgi:hypothetical protein
MFGFILSQLLMAAGWSSIRKKCKEENYPNQQFYSTLSIIAIILGLIIIIRLMLG